jgi:hypothetical protein
MGEESRLLSAGKPAVELPTGRAVGRSSRTVGRRPLVGRVGTAGTPETAGMVDREDFGCCSSRSFPQVLPRHRALDGARALATDGGARNRNGGARNNTRGVS